jgi:hypothetical protein
MRHPAPKFLYIPSTGEARRITLYSYAAEFACGEAISLDPHGREPDAEVYCAHCAGAKSYPTYFDSDPEIEFIHRTPALSVVLAKAAERKLKVEVSDRRSAYIDGRPCQVIRTSWFKSYPFCYAMTIYMPRNEFADFLIYVPYPGALPDGLDPVYIVPRAKIMYDSTWTEDALEPYKNAWRLLKETSPALFKRGAVVLSPQLRRVIEVANKRGLPYELIPLKGERAKRDYRNYKQRRILIAGRRCAIFTVTLFASNSDGVLNAGIFKTTRDEWPEIFLYIFDDDIYVVPRERIPHTSALSLFGSRSRIYEYRNAWCVLSGVDPASSEQIAEYERRMNRLTRGKQP